MKLSKHNLATILKIFNVVTFAICSLIWKLKIPNVSAEQQYFLQAFTATIILLALIILLPNNEGKFHKKIISSLKIKSPKSYLYRAIFNFLGVMAWIKAIKLIDINEAMAITYLTPIITCFIAVFLLGEKIRVSWVAALFFASLGITIMLSNSDSTTITLQQNSSDHIIGILLGMFFAVATSMYNIICKQQTNSDDNYFAQAFYCAFLGTIFSLPFVVMNSWTPLTFEETVWAMGVGALGSMSVVALFLAYKLSDVTKISPHSYLKIIITAITMYIMKDEIPSQQLTFAITLIILGNFCVIFENTFYKIIGKKVVVEGV